jgi:hypothetical protein
MFGKISRNCASSWTQSGHLEGRVRKVRTRPAISPAAAAYAALLGSLAGFGGPALLASPWIVVLDRSKAGGAGSPQESGSRWPTAPSCGGRCSRDRGETAYGRGIGDPRACQLLTNCCATSSGRRRSRGATISGSDAALRTCSRTAHPRPDSGIRGDRASSRPRWLAPDLAVLVAPWLAAHPLFDGLVAQPDELPDLVPEFAAHVGETVRGTSLPPSGRTRSSPVRVRVRSSD